MVLLQNYSYRIKGYSLVELAVSICLLALVGVGATIGLQTALNASINTTVEQTENSLGLLVLQTLQQDLLTATSVTIPDANHLIIQPGRLANGTSPASITWVYDSTAMGSDGGFVGGYAGTFTRNGVDLRTLSSLPSDSAIPCSSTACFSGKDQAGIATTGLSPENPVSIVTLSGMAVRIDKADSMANTFKEGLTKAGKFQNGSYEFRLAAGRTFQ